VTGIPAAGGYDPLALVRLMQVRLSLSPGERWGTYYDASNPASRVLDFLNVRCLSAHAPIRPEILAASGLRQVAEIEGHHLYENTHALPRFFFVPRSVPVSSLAAALSLIRTPSWRPGDEAAVEAAPSALPAPGGLGSVRVLAYRMNSVELFVDTTAPALLVSSEVNYPGWRVSVDGRASKILVCNGAFRGVVLPAGKHTVEFRFLPPVLIAGGAVSFGAWLLCALLWRRGAVQIAN
jgi:hypothetical protein